MVRIARLSWTDEGPLSPRWDRSDWLDDEEGEDTERASHRVGRPRRRRPRTSPVDRRRSGNAPADSLGETP